MANLVHSNILRSSAESGHLQDALHHGSDPVKDLVDRSVAHEGACGDQLVLLVHVALADALADVLAAQLVDGFGRARRIWIPEREKKKKELLAA